MLEDSAVERSSVGGFCLEIVTRERRHFFRADDWEDMEVSSILETLYCQLFAYGRTEGVDHCASTICGSQSRSKAGNMPLCTLGKMESISIFLF